MASISTARQIHQCLVNDTLFPDTLSHTLSVDEAYDVQFELLALRLAAGDTHAGWKVGLTAKAMQEQQGVHEPCLGHLVGNGQLSSPAPMIFDRLMAPGFENELCMRMKAPLSGADVGLDAAKAAVGSVAPAIEVIEKRGVFKDDFPLAVAGNAQQCAFVTGEFRAYDAEMELSTIQAEIFVNGQSRETATGRVVLGDPMKSIVWLTHKLSQYGRSLQPGDLVMSGSFTSQYDVAKGDHVRTQFSELGAVEVHFA